MPITYIAGNYVDLSKYYNTAYLAIIALMYGLVNIKMFADDKELQEKKKTEYSFSVIIMLLLLIGLVVSLYRAYHK